MNNTYDFKTELRKVYTLDEHENATVEIPRRKAVVRTDTNQTLGVVSDGYKVIKHSDAIDAFRESLGDRGEQVKVSLAKNGAHMYATYNVRDAQVEVQKGDIVGLQVIVRNSYDGMTSLQIMLGALRLVCTNGMVIGKGFFNFSQRHIGKDAQINIGGISDMMGRMTDRFHETLPILQRMSRTEMPIDGLFDSEEITLPQYLLDHSKTSYEKKGDKSVWGYYNSLTDAISHNMRKESPLATINHGKVAWDTAVGILESKP